MDTNDLFSRLGVALAIGLLVGLERGWRSRDEKKGQRAAGFRTFALTGLLGGIAGLLSLTAGGMVLAAAFIVFSAAFTAFQWLEARADNDLSATSTVAGMLTFLLGSLAIIGDVSVAIGGAVAATGLLALREPLHRWVASLTWPEIRAALVLLAMSFLLLPLLPNRTIDPLDVLNPYEIWLLTIFIAATSSVGYVAVRVFGDRAGIVMTAIAGGLASSTATTLALARLARGRPASARLITGGILIAGTVMVARVCVVTLVLNSALAPYLLPSLLAGAVVLVAGALLMLLGHTGTNHADITIHNPLALGSALRLAAILMIVLLAGELLRRALGTAGLMLVAAVSGIADVDATVITMARLGTQIPTAEASLGVLVAVGINTVAKAILAAMTGGRRVGLAVGVVSGAAIAAAAVAAVWPFLFR